MVSKVMRHESSKNLANFMCPHALFSQARSQMELQKAEIDHLTIINRQTDLEKNQLKLENSQLKSENSQLKCEVDQLKHQLVSVIFYIASCIILLL